MGGDNLLKGDIRLVDPRPTDIHPSLPPQSSFLARMELLRLSRNLVNHPMFLGSLYSDVCIIPTLWMQVVLCPYPGLRYEALQMLRDMGHRIEGSWDSQFVVMQGEVLLDIEEPGDSDRLCTFFQRIDQTIYQSREPI